MLSSCLADMFPYLIGPINKHICLLEIMIKNSVKCQAFLLVNAITISRYLFIFWLKNPGAVWDDFWAAFITSWIIIFCSIYNFVYFYLPGSQPLTYYLCSSIDPQKDQNPPKQPVVIFESFSILIIIFIQIRIFLFKKKPSQVTNNKTVRIIFHRQVFSENETISDFKSNLYSILNFILLTVASFQGNNMTMNEIRDNQAYVYFIHLTGPGFFIFVFASLHYIRHAPLRKTIYRELIDCLKC